MLRSTRHNVLAAAAVISAIAFAGCAQPGPNGGDSQGTVPIVANPGPSSPAPSPAPPPAPAAAPPSQAANAPQAGQTVIGPFPDQVTKPGPIDTSLVTVGAPIAPATVASDETFRVACPVSNANPADAKATVVLTLSLDGAPLDTEQERNDNIAFIDTNTTVLPAGMLDGAVGRDVTIHNRWAQSVRLAGNINVVLTQTGQTVTSPVFYVELTP
ncbi:MAG: hypothetical protein KGJ62_09335 [Armatimonadetes bacterium]|nr:hypothetical protein [Armatimonadota bacterium]MDE2207835.1 hypothetical protein [Armatimonadota bacterium]